LGEVFCLSSVHLFSIHFICFLHGVLWCILMLWTHNIFINVLAWMLQPSHMNYLTKCFKEIYCIKHRNHRELITISLWGVTRRYKTIPYDIWNTMEELYEVKIVIEDISQEYWVESPKCLKKLPNENMLVCSLDSIGNLTIPELYASKNLFKIW
jgi:hypothetical protein